MEPLGRVRDGGLNGTIEVKDGIIDGIKTEKQVEVILNTGSL